MRIAVTGGSGTIGRAVVAAARAAGHAVIAVGRTHGHAGGARDEGWLAGCDALIDVEARAPELGPDAGFRSADPSAAERTIAAARRHGVGRIVLVSSLAVLTLDGGEGVDARRRAPTRSTFGYAAALRRIEASVLAAGGVVARPGLWTVGRGDAVVGRLARALRAGRLPLIGGGEGRLNLVDADDLARGLLACATAPAAAGNLYALADPTPLTWRAVLTTFASLVGGPPPRRLWRDAPTDAVASALERAYGIARPATESSLTHFRIALLGRGLHVRVDDAERELGWRPLRPWRDALRDAAIDALARAGIHPVGRIGRRIAPVTPQRPTGAGTRVLLATVDAGGGHTSAAQAWAARFAALGAQVQVLDTVAALGPARLDRAAKAAWRAALRVPRAVAAAQAVTTHVVPAGLTQRLQGVSVADHARRLARFVNDEGFDLVLATHMFPLQALAIARRRGWSDVPIVGFNPDTFDTHALFAVRGSDAICVPTEEAARRLLRFGIGADEIVVTGYPIDDRFLHPPARLAARTRLGIDPGATMVLLSLGAEGVGPRAEAWVDDLLAGGTPLTIAVLTGRNEALHARLQARAAALARGQVLLPLGFRRDVPDWLAAADLVIAKAGPASTLEALAVGTPLAHVYVAGGHERLVVDFALSRGVGAWWPQARMGASEALGWLGDPAGLAAWRERMRAVELPVAHDADVSAVLGLARARGGTTRYHST